MNIRTLLSTINEINQDADRFQQKIRIERHSRSDLILSVSRDFSLFYFKLQYLKESILYQILDSAFSHPNTTMLALAEENHLSPASLYRKLSKFKEHLNAFDLEFDAARQSPIIGNEKNVRFFYLKFYWYSVQLLEWPFSQELRALCLDIYKEVFTNQFKVQTLPMQEKTLLWLAINIRRIQDGHRLKDEEVTEMNTLIEKNISFLEFQAKFDKALTKICPEDITFNKEDYVLFYTLLLCDEDYFSETTFALLTLSGQNRSTYEEATLTFLNTLVTYLKRPLTHEEYYNIYRKLLIINMHAYFFPEKKIFFTLNYRFDHLQDYYLDFKTTYDEFYTNLYKGEEKHSIFKSNPNLYYKYILLLVNNLDITTFYSEINIKFFNLESPHMNSFYQRKIQTLTPAPISFIPEFDKDRRIDLIISHTQPETNYENYFIMNIPATPWDWERLKLELIQIQSKKRVSS